MHQALRAPCGALWVPAVIPRAVQDGPAPRALRPGGGGEPPSLPHGAQVVTPGLSVGSQCWGCPGGGPRGFGMARWACNSYLLPGGLAAGSGLGSPPLASLTPLTSRDTCTTGNMENLRELHPSRREQLREAQPKVREVGGSPAPAWGSASLPMKQGQGPAYHFHPVELLGADAGGGLGRGLEALGGRRGPQHVPSKLSWASEESSPCRSWSCRNRMMA